MFSRKSTFTETYTYIYIGIYIYVHTFFFDSCVVLLNFYQEGFSVCNLLLLYPSLELHKIKENWHLEGVHTLEPKHCMHLHFLGQSVYVSEAVCM